MYAIRNKMNITTDSQDNGTKMAASDTERALPFAPTFQHQPIATHPLHQKILGDVFVASVVTFGVAPFLTIVDKAIVQHAAGTNTLFGSASASIAHMARNPRGYLSSPTFLLMWSVYAATYSTANSLKTITEHFEHQERKQYVASQPPRFSATNLGPWAVFAGTTLVNSGTSLLKDRAYARMFSVASAVARPVPGLTYTCWIARDITVVGSSFLLPGILAQQIHQHRPEMDKADIQQIAQLSLPLVAQILAGPLHFMGLDIYNRNLGSSTWPQAIKSRAKALWYGAPPVIVARIARIAPGYGFGGVLNTKYRDAWRENLVYERAATTTAAAAKSNDPNRLRL